MIHCKMQFFIMIDNISTNKATSVVDLLLSLFLVSDTVSRKQTSHVNVL